MDANALHQAHRASTVARHSGTVHLFAGDLLAACADLHSVTYLADAQPDDLAGAAAELALVHALYGEHAIAERWADQADAVADGWALDRLEPGPHVAQLCAQLILATDRLDWPRYEEILGRLHTGRFGHDDHLLLTLYAQARAGLVRGQQRQLLDRITQLRRSWPGRLPPGSLPQLLLGAVETDLALSVGDHQRAKALIPDRLTDHHQVLQLARWQLATGRHTEAADLITGGPWLQQAPRRGLIDLNLALATALDRIGDHRRSARLVLRALTQAGDPQTVGHSLVSTDRQTLINAGSREPAVGAALDRLRLELVLPPDPDAESWPGAALTPREQVILELLADGGTAADIAGRLFVSVHTVRNQIQRVYRKLHATSRRHAIDLAIQQGLLSATVRQRASAAG